MERPIPQYVPSKQAIEVELTAENQGSHSEDGEPGDSGQLLGMVSLEDLLRARVRHLARTATLQAADRGPGPQLDPLR